MLVTLEFDNTKVVRQQLAQTLQNVTKVRLVKLIYTVSWTNITSANNSITYGSNGFGMPDGLYNVSHIQQFFTNNSINATITLNQATGRISIRSDQNMFLAFSALLGFSNTYIFTANTTHTGSIPSLIFKNINITLREINSYHNIKNSSNSNVLHSMKNTQAFYGDTVEYEPDKKIFLNLNTNILTHLEIGAADNLGNDILKNNIYFQAILEII